MLREICNHSAHKECVMKSRNDIQNGRSEDIFVYTAQYTKIKKDFHLLYLKKLKVL